MTIQIEVTKQYSLVVLLIMLHKVVLIFESVDEIRLTIQKKAVEPVVVGYGPKGILVEVIN